MARIDTCANVNVIPVSMHKLLYKDPDCVKIAPCSKSGISTYTTEKTPVLGSCDLFIVHPNTRSLKLVTFQVVNCEGSIIISCATSLELGLIQLHIVLYTRVPDGRRLIFSSANDPKKMQKCEAQVTMCSGKKGQETSLRGQTDQQSNTKKNQVYMGEDHKCQVPISADKNFQAENIKGPQNPKRICKQRTCNRGEKHQVN